MSSPQSPPTPLETLLRVKQNAEEAAGRRLQVAGVRRAAAEERQQDLDAEVRAARGEMRARRAAAAITVTGADGGATTAAAGQRRERFWGRLRDEIAARAERATVHRRGSLASVRAEQEAALAAHRAARGERLQVEKLHQRADADRRRLGARKEEVALDEQAQAAAFSRAAPPSFRGSSGR